MSRLRPEILRGILDAPSCCSLVLVAKSFAWLKPTFDLLFQEYHWMRSIVHQHFAAAPTELVNARESAYCCIPSAELYAQQKLAHRNRFLTQLCVFYGYAELALLLRGGRRRHFSFEEQHALIAVVLGRAEILNDARLWPGAAPQDLPHDMSKSTLVAMARTEIIRAIADGHVLARLYGDAGEQLYRRTGQLLCLPSLTPARRRELRTLRRAVDEDSVLPWHETRDHAQVLQRVHCLQQLVAQQKQFTN